MSVALVVETLPIRPISRSAVDEPIERFHRVEGERSIIRSVRTRTGCEFDTTIAVNHEPKSADLAAEFDSAWLRSPKPPTQGHSVDIRFADLFAGCGAMSIGIVEACRALGKTAYAMFAVDMNAKALDVY